MKRINRIFFSMACIGLLLISWIVVIATPTSEEKELERQKLLMEQADELIKDEVYVPAVSILEEAVSYNTKNILEAETMLKKVCLELIDQGGYRNKYVELLEKQMNRDDAAPEIFVEAAEYYLNINKLSDAFAVLKEGVEKTGSEEIINLYENNRYVYVMGSNIYDDVTNIYGKTISVQREGLWGVARSGGSLLIPCYYEKISTYSIDRVIVQKQGEIYAVDSNNNRLALLKENISDFGNYTNGYIPLQTKEGWKYASGEFETVNMIFEDVKAFFNDYAAAKQNGKWGVMNTSFEWLVPAGYDEIIMDELGRSYAQGAVFAKKDNVVSLFVDGKQANETYEDAKPFGDEGYAAVKKGGKWGFINTLGEVIIDYQFEDALSFGQHLAAIKQGEFWGYISLYGKVVIEPVFLQAKSFANGNAPVLTEQGWQFISLIEYGN